MKNKLAISDFDRAISLAPTIAMFYGFRGATHRNANDIPKALEDYARAIELSPQFAPAYAMLAGPLIREYINNWVEQPEKSLARAHELAQHAVELDDLLPQAHWMLGLTSMWMKQLVS